MVRKYFLRLHPDIVAFWLKGPFWIGLGVFIFLSTLDATVYVFGPLILISTTFASLWVTTTGLFIVSLCSDKYGLSINSFRITVLLHWLSALGILSWLVTFLFYDNPLYPLIVLGELWTASIFVYVVTFMVMWRTRMRGMV